MPRKHSLRFHCVLPIIGNATEHIGDSAFGLGVGVERRHRLSDGQRHCLDRQQMATPTSARQSPVCAVLHRSGSNSREKMW